MTKFEKPIILCYTKKDLDEYIFTSASCTQSLCGQGSSYTCGTSINYTCSKSDYSNSNCSQGNSFTCGKTNNHVDNIEEWI